MAGNNKISVRYTNVTVEVELAVGEPLTVEQLLAKPGLKQSLHVEPNAAMGLVSDRARTTLLPTKARITEQRYVLVPVWRAEVEWQNSAGVQLNTTTVNYLPDSVPSVQEIVQDLKTQLNIAHGDYALKAPTTGSTSSLLSMGATIPSGRYILCPSVHYRIRYPKREKQKQKDKEKENKYGDNQHQEKEKEKDHGQAIVEVDSAHLLSSEQLAQSIPQLVTTYTFPVLFPDDDDDSCQDIEVQSIDTVGSKQVVGDAIPGGNYVIVFVHKYVVRKPAAFDSARSDRRQSLFYKQPQTADQLMADLSPAVNRSSHLLYFDVPNLTGNKGKQQQAKIRCPQNIPFDAGPLVLEHIIAFTVVVPALNNEKLHIPVSPDATVIEMLEDPNLLPLTEQNEQNPAQQSTSTTNENKSKMVVLAKGYDYTTQTLIDILSPVTQAQDLRPPNLFAGWDYALDLLVLVNQTDTHRVKFPVSDNFDSVRKLLTTTTSTPSSAKWGLYSALTQDRVMEMSGPVVKNLRLNKISGGVSVVSLHLEPLIMVELLIPGYTEPQQRWIPQNWTIQNTVRLLQTLFEFEKRGFNPRRQVAVMYITGATEVPLPGFALLNTFDNQHFTIKFENAVQLALDADEHGVQTITTSIKTKAQELTRLAEHLFPALKRTSPSLAVCLPHPETKALMARLPDDGIFAEDSPVLRFANHNPQPLTTTHTVLVKPGVPISVTLAGNTITRVVPACFTINELQQHMAGGGDSKFYSVSSTSASSSSLPLAYTETLLALTEKEKATSPLKLVFKPAQPVSVQTTFQGKSHLFLPMPDTAELRTMLQVAKQHYNLMEGQEFEIIGKNNLDDLLRKHAHPNNDVLLASFTLELLVRTHVVIYDDAKHVLFSRTVSANSTVDNMLEAYRSHLRLHPSCMIQLFTLDTHALVDGNRRHASFARPTAAEDMRLFSSSGTHHPGVFAHHPGVFAHHPSSTLVEFLALHHQQQVPITIYNLHGIGAPKKVNTRKFALAGEIAHAASLEFGHANGISTWSLAPHLLHGSVPADKQVDPEKAYDLIETGPSRKFVVIKTLPHGHELVLPSHLPVSKIPHFDATFDDVMLAGDKYGSGMTAIQNLALPVGSIAHSGNGIVALHITPKPDLVITATYNGAVQVLKQNIRNRVQDMLEYLKASSDAVVTNMVSGAVITDKQDYIASHGPHYTFTISDANAPATVTIQCRGQKRTLEVNGEWTVRRLLAAALRRYNLGTALTSWGLFLNAGTHPLHPESIPNYTDQSVFVLRRLSSSSSSTTNPKAKKKVLPAVALKKAEQATEDPPTKLKGKKGKTSGKSCFPSSASSGFSNCSSSRSERKAQLKIVENTNNTTVYAAALAGVVVLAAGAVAVIL